MSSSPASAQVPKTMISTAPSSSIRSITGANRPEIRVLASDAAILPSASRSKRASSRPCVLADWTSAALPSASSATAVSEPLRRRASRAARRDSRAKLLAAKKQSGTTTSAASASFHDSRNSAPVKNSSRAAAVTSSPSADRTSVSIARTSLVIRASTSPWRRRSSASGSSVCRCANSRRRRLKVKRSPTQVAAYSSPNERIAPSSASPTMIGT